MLVKFRNILLINKNITYKHLTFTSMYIMKTEYYNDYKIWLHILYSIVKI